LARSRKLFLNQTAAAYPNEQAVTGSLL